MDVHSKPARYRDASDQHAVARRLARRSVAAHSRPQRMHPSIPRVLCPSCGELMRLSRIDPSPSSGRRGATTIFECSCGDDYRQTILERI
jgi:hypothetical protein